MAFGRLERTTGDRPMSEINMTPLIDVMLVLLVIFMITAPLMTASLKLDLPKIDAPRPTDTPKFITVALDPKGQLYFGDEPLAEDAFTRRIADVAHANPASEVQLRADRSVPYGRVAELIAMLQKAGLTRIGFVAAQDTSATSTSTNSSGRSTAATAGGTAMSPAPARLPNPPPASR